MTNPKKSPPPPQKIKTTATGRPCTVGRNARVHELHEQGKTNAEINEMILKEFGSCSLGHVVKVLTGKVLNPRLPKATKPTPKMKAGKSKPQRAAEQIAEGMAKLGKVPLAKN